MGQRFCTECGADLPPGIRFCEGCGAPVESEHAGPAAPAEPSSVKEHGKGRSKGVVIAAAAILFILVVAAFALFILPILTHSSSGSVQVPATSVPPSVTPVTTVSNPATRATPVPDPYPHALQLKDSFPFGEGSTAGIGTVYRVWINDSYTWHNDKDNKYYVQAASPGSNYLFLFVNVYNAGDARFWPPTASTIHLLYNNQEYYQDPAHFIPDKLSDPRDTPVEVKEVQYFSKLFGSEYVEDYGLSHGNLLAYLYPGKSNAIDGYLIYVVPASLSLDKTYAKIDFNVKDSGIWRLG